MRPSSHGTPRDENTQHGRPGPRSRRQGATPQRRNQPPTARPGDAVTGAITGVITGAIAVAGELGERKGG